MQERQQRVRDVVEAVRQAEVRIDDLVKDLHEIEAELSLLIHRSETASKMNNGRHGTDFVCLLYS